MLLQMPGSIRARQEQANCGTVTVVADDDPVQPPPTEPPAPTPGDGEILGIPLTVIAGIGGVALLVVLVFAFS